MSEEHYEFPGNLLLAQGWVYISGRNYVLWFVYKEEAFFIICIPQKASIDFYWAFIFRSNFIPSHCISPSRFPFASLCLCQQVAHKHTCLPCSQGAAGQKAPSAAHLSPATSTAKPSFQQSSLADTPNGVLGYGAAWPVAGWCFREAWRMSNHTFFSHGGFTRLDRPDTYRLMDLNWFAANAGVFYVFFCLFFLND